MNKQVIKDALILIAITLVAGLLLGGVYQLTKAPIAKAAEDKKNEAYRAVFADASSFTADGLKDGNATRGTAFDWEIKNTDTIEECLLAVASDGTPLGVVMTVTSHEGYGGDITMAIGIRADGTVNGISFLTINETIGLGMEAKKPEFYEQFSGKTLDPTVPITYTKSGATLDSEIDAISGATITSNAVTNAVNAGRDYAGCIDYGISTDIPTEAPAETPTEAPAETQTEAPAETPTEAPTEIPATEENGGEAE